MKIYSYCSSCSKKAYTVDGYLLERRGEGCIVLSTSNGVENIKECSSCEGTGMKFVKEVTFNGSEWK